MAPTLLRYRFCGYRFVRGYPIFPRVLCFRVLCFRVQRLCRIRRFVLVGRLVRVWGIILIRWLSNNRRRNSRRRLPTEGRLRQGGGRLKIERLEAAYLNRRGGRFKRTGSVKGNSR